MTTKTAKTASQYAARLKDLKREKEPFLQLYQSVGEIFFTRKADFLHVGSPGEFLQGEIFDNTPQFALYVFASVCLSMLWPDAARTFNIVPAPQLRGQAGVEDYFRRVSAKMHLSMDRAEAGLILALMEHFLDQGAFGLSGVAGLDGPAEDNDLPVVYEAWDVKSMFISENRRGFVDTIYLVIEKTVRQVYEEFGSSKNGDKISPRVVEAYEKGRLEDKIEVLLVVEPKQPAEIETGKRGLASMAYRAVHVDLTNVLKMREGGFEEMPTAVARMFKRVGEVYARSPAMVALPAAVNLNNLSEAIIVATEKQLDPPLGLLDDGRLGGGVVDTSAGALSVFNASGRMAGEKPIFPLFTVGEMQSSKELKEQLIQEIMQAFFLDRLLDLNNKTMMTAYETSVRNRLRGESTGSLFARQIAEVLIPLIKRTFNIMYRKGHFGDFPGVPKDAPGSVARRAWAELTGKDEMMVPEVVLKAVEAGLDVYDIEFISPAQRFMQAEKLQGLMTQADAVLSVAALNPAIMDTIDWDDWAGKVSRYGGAPPGPIRSADDLRNWRAAQAERQDAAVALEAGDKMAAITQKIAAAKASQQAMGTR